MVIKYMLTLVMASMCQKMKQNVTLLQSFLLALCLYTKTNVLASVIRELCA